MRTLSWRLAQFKLALRLVGQQAPEAFNRIVSHPFAKGRLETRALLPDNQARSQVEHSRMFRRQSLRPPSRFTRRSGQASAR